MEEMTERLEIRLTPEENDRILKRMEQMGIRNRSAYLRRIALNGYMIRLDLTDVKELVRLLGIYGNNLNQYARRANETGSIYIEDIREIQNNQKEIWKIMREILQKLSSLEIDRRG